MNERAPVGMKFPLASRLTNRLSEYWKLVWEPYPQVRTIRGLDIKDHVTEDRRIAIAAARAFRPYRKDSVEPSGDVIPAGPGTEQIKFKKGGIIISKDFKRGPRKPKKDGYRYARWGHSSQPLRDTRWPHGLVTHSGLFTTSWPRCVTSIHRISGMGKTFYPKPYRGYDFFTSPFGGTLYNGRRKK